MTEKDTYRNHFPESEHNLSGSFNHANRAFADSEIEKEALSVVYKNEKESAPDIHLSYFDIRLNK